MRTSSLALISLCTVTCTTVPLRRAVSQQPVAADDRAVFDPRAMDELLARPVTLSVTQVSRKVALDAIAGSAKVLIQYQAQMVNETGSLVTLHLKRVPLRTALERLFAGTKLYLVTDKTGQLSIGEQANRTANVTDSGTVGGRVTDSVSGRGVSGAIVSMQGLRVSARTDHDGRYTLRDIPVGQQTMLVKLLGYRLVTMPVDVHADVKVTANVAVMQTTTVLSGVVTTATGLQRKLEVGNDITTLNVDSILQVAPIRTLTDLLETRVPGMTVIRSSGIPGAPSRVRLRGTSSPLGNNDPIVVVDGIRVYAIQSDPRTGNGASATGFSAPSPLDQIDPNTIEKIDVLKGASASSLYGSDAANGVIVITTKRGRTGRTYWNLAVDQGIEYSPGKYPDVVTQWGKQALNSPSAQCRGSLCAIYDSTTRFQPLNNPRFTRFGRGSSNEITGTVSGGTNALGYSFTGSAGTATGLLKLPDDQRQLFRTLQHVSVPAWALRPDRLSKWGGSGSMSTNPVPDLQINVTAGIFSNSQEQTSLTAGITNVEYIDTTLAMLGNYYEHAKTDLLTMRGGVSTHWVPRAWLPIDGTIGIDVATNHGDAFLPRGYHLGSDSLGSYGVHSGSSLTRTVTLLTRIPVYGSRVESAFGFNYHDESLTDVTASIKSVPVGLVPPTELGTDVIRGTSSQQSVGVATFGWYVEPKLNFNSRFFVVPGFRLDGGSSGTRSTFSGFSGFPKLSASYIASDEPWFPLKRFVSVLRIRGAYGHAGVQPSPGQKLRLASALTDISDDGNSTTESLANVAIGNTQLRPERSVEFERGFDAELLGRANVTMTYVTKTRKDAIINIGLPPSLGIDGGTLFKNIGVIRNRSFEMTGDVQLLRSRLVGWSVNANVSKLTSVVVSLNAGEKPVIYDATGFSSGFSIVPGYPLNGVWARPIRGFADADGDGFLSLNEVAIGENPVFLGPSEPNYELNVGNQLDFFNRRITVAAAMAYTDGMTQTRSVTGAISPNTPFSEQAANVALQSTVYGYVQQVSTLRFNSLSISYMIPASVAGQLRAKSASVALQGSNLGLHTNYRGKDPNVNGSPYGNTIVDTGQLPTPRKWILRFSLVN